METPKGRSIPMRCMRLVTPLGRAAWEMAPKNSLFGYFDVCKRKMKRRQPSLYEPLSVRKSDSSGKAENGSGAHALGVTSKDDPCFC